MQNKHGRRIEITESPAEFLQTIAALKQARSDSIELSPLDAIGYDCIIDTAIDLKNARISLEQVEKSCQENARRRRISEESIETSTLPQRLLKSPLATLAEARSTLQGNRQILQLWLSLGRLLSTEQGWNEEELHLVRCLVGQGSDQLRLSREAVKLSAALKADQELPIQFRQNAITAQLIRSSEILLAGLREIAPEETSLHAAILRLFAERQIPFLNVDMDLIFNGSMSNNMQDHDFSDKVRWPALRRFVARQILSCRKICHRMELQNKSTESSQSAVHYTIQELKRIETARKAVVSATACFQKSITSAKSMGLTGNNKPSKKSTVESNNCNDLIFSDDTTNPPKMKKTRSSLKSKSTVEKTTQPIETVVSMEPTTDRISKPQQKPKSTRKPRSPKCTDNLSLQPYSESVKTTKSSNSLSAPESVPAWLVENDRPRPNVRNRGELPGITNPDSDRTIETPKSPESATPPPAHSAAVESPAEDQVQNAITSDNQSGCNTQTDLRPDSPVNPPAGPENRNNPYDPPRRLVEELKKRQTKARPPGRKKRQGPQPPPENPSS